MSPQAVAQLEQELEDTGKLSLTLSQAQGLFDARARKLVKMSGRKALRYIRSGKSRSRANVAWAELQVLAALLK